MLLLKVAEHNWGLIGPGDWEKRSWKISDDGWYQYKEKYKSGAADDLPEIPEVVEENTLSAAQMEKLKELLDQHWSTETTDACDGVAWEFKLYDSTGKVIKYRDLGYIIDINPFDAIAALLTEELYYGH